MVEKDIYTRKTEEKIKRARARLFSLRLRSANSPYDIHTIYPQKFNTLKGRLSMFSRSINMLKTSTHIDVTLQYRM